MLKRIRTWQHRQRRSAFKESFWNALDMGSERPLDNVGCDRSTRINWKYWRGFMIFFFKSKILSSLLALTAVIVIYLARCWQL